MRQKSNVFSAILEMYFSLKFSSVIPNAYWSHENLLILIQIPPICFQSPFSWFPPFDTQSHTPVTTRVCSRTSPVADLAKGPLSLPTPPFYFWQRKEGCGAKTYSILTQGPITWGGLARLAGRVRFAGARLWNALKINFAITWKNLSSASWDPGIAMPESRLAGLKI